MQLDVKKSKEEGQTFEEEKLLDGIGSEYIVVRYDLFIYAQVSKICLNLCIVAWPWIRSFISLIV